MPSQEGAAQEEAPGPRLLLVQKGTKCKVMYASPPPETLGDAKEEPRTVFFTLSVLEDTNKAIEGEMNDDGKWEAGFGKKQR